MHCGQAHPVTPGTVWPVMLASATLTLTSSPLKAEQPADQQPLRMIQCVTDRHGCKELFVIYGQVFHVDVVVKRPSAHPHFLADKVNGQGFISIQLFGIPGLELCFQTQSLGPPSFSAPGCTQACLGTFPDDVLLKLCQRSKEVEDKAALCRLDVDPILQGDELHFLFLQAFDQIYDAIKRY